MIYVPRAALEAAITAGATRYSRWMLCRVDGSVYCQSNYAEPHKHKHEDIFIPSLYPDGSGTRFALFCAWARKQDDVRRGEELIALAYGKTHACNPEGFPYSVPTIVEHFLTQGERAEWESIQAGRIRTFCEICMQQLNAIGGRARYRWRYPERPMTLVSIPGPAWASSPHIPIPDAIREKRKDDSGIFAIVR